MPFGFVVSGDSDIRTFDDLKPEVAGPRKFGVWVASPPMAQDMYAFIEWLGLDRENEKECIIVPFGSYSSYVRSLSEGKADVVYASPYSPATYEAEAAPGGLRWVPIPTDDPEGEARFRKYKPITTFAEPTVGVESARGVRMAQGLVFYYTRADQDPELVYHLAKWFNEAFDEYKDKDPALFQMSLEELKKYHLPVALFPWHEGTITYLKEMGVWTAEDDARQEKNVALMTQWVEAYAAAIDEAHEKGMKIDPQSEEWQNLWASYNKDLPRYTFY